MGFKGCTMGGCSRVLQWGFEGLTIFIFIFGCPMFGFMVFGNVCQAYHVFSSCLPSF